MVKRYALVVREGDTERTVLIGSLAEIIYRAEQLLIAGDAVGIRPCWL